MSRKGFRENRVTAAFVAGDSGKLILLMKWGEMGGIAEDLGEW